LGHAPPPGSAAYGAYNIIQLSNNDKDKLLNTVKTRKQSEITTSTKVGIALVTTQYLVEESSAIP